jgi:hypothetical protein
VPLRRAAGPAPRPNIRASVEVSVQIRVDVAIVAESSQSRPEYPDLQIDRLFDDPLLVAVARTHWLASARGITPDVLADEAWIVGSSDHSEGLLGVWDSATWAPRIAFTAKNWNAKIGLVAAGLGITVVPALSAASFGGRIRLLRINDDRAAQAVLLARPASTTTTEPSHQLATILRDQARGMARRPSLCMIDCPSGTVDTPFFGHRGRPYSRGFPRPVSPSVVAGALLEAVRRSRPEVFVLRWLSVPARINGALPETFHRLATRFG